MRRSVSALRREDGMTIIELMIAAMICVVGLLATIAVLDQSRRVGNTSEARVAVSHHAERELERLAGLTWATLGHQVVPTPAGTAPTPSSYVNLGTYAFDRRDNSRREPLKVVAGGLVPHTVSTWTDNQSRLAGKLYRYVTEVTPQARRVTVAVTADAPADVPPLYLSTLVTEPST